MAYKALYRSYRPNSFGTVIGQEHIIKTLKNALTTKKTSHAYIFSGPRGIGKTTIARILAKAINCEDLQNGEPCNKCASCRLINNNETPDIIELDAASNNGVDEIRAVLEKVNFLPGVLKNKVYIIDEVHMLSISAFNALLKTLEEPPSHVMFILATTEPHKIPATILSRCQRFDFKPLTVKEIKANLKNIADKEKIAIEDAALNLVAEASEGGMRDAIGILDQVNAYSTTEITLDDVNNVTGRISNQKIIELMQTINEGNSVKGIDLTNELLSLGKEASRLVEGLMQVCRDILLYQSTDGELNDKLIYDDMAFKMLCNTINKKKVFCYIDILSDVQNKIKFSLSQKIFLEVGIMKMSNVTKEDYETQVVFDGVSSVAGLDSFSEERISNLEASLNKLKSELVKLNLNDFKEETKEKLALLEEVNKASQNNSSFNIEEVLEEINNIKIQLSTNNNSDDFDADLLDKINSRIDELENEANTEVSEKIEKLEEHIQQVFEQLEGLANKVEECAVENKEEARELTLFDFNNNVDYSVEINELKEKLETLKNEITELQKTYSRVEEVLDELILDTQENQTIQKRQNPYEQKVQEIVETQRELEQEDQPEEIVETQELTKPEQLTLDVFENVNEEVEEMVEEPSEEFVDQPEEEKAVDDMILEQAEEITEEPSEEVSQTEIPEEMTRSIDDLFNNPVFFNKPLEEKTEVQEPIKETPVEEPKKVVEVKKEEPVEPKKYMTIEDFERVVEEEKHYDLICNVQNLEAGLRKMATLDKVPLDVLNYVVLDLYGMRDDIQTFIKDKNNGVFVNDPLLEKAANKNIKTFLITISVRDAMIASTKDKEVKKLIEEIKTLIKEFRNAKEASTPVQEIAPVKQAIVEEPKVEVQKPVVVEKPKVEIQEPVVVEEPKVEVQEPAVVEEPKVEVQEPVVVEEPKVEEPKKTTFQLENLIIKDEPEIVEKPVETMYKRATVIETRNKQQDVRNIPNDNPYAIEKIEMVMHDSRSEISREERKIILNNWRRLGERVGAGLLPVARFLMDGNPVVNGNNCIIITYPNAALCNHIMSDKIKVQAKQILKITFGREYEYIALPENIWQDKRNEYRGQYQMGTRYPKLTPINNPELRIIKKSFVDEKNASYNKALDLFGENLIKEEE